MPTHLTRRMFLQSASALTAASGLDLQAANPPRELKIAHTTQTRSVCPYCAVGCSVIIHTLGDKSRNVTPTVVHVEGDPDSPVNRGTLCSKGIGLKEFIVNDQRLTQPLYRAPGAAGWTMISWDQAFERMTRLIKDTRDHGFEVDDAEGRRVNRLPSVGLIGGCTDTTEINFLLGKFRFGLGILSYEHQARL
jgi:formate dehydrogenase major subunit